MSNCNYTDNTEYKFDKPCENPCENIHLVGVYPQNKIERALSCNNINTNEWVQFYVSEIVDIPEQKPDMEGIISVNSCIEIISQKVIRTAQVSGYRAADGSVVNGEDIPNSECTHLTGRKLIIEGILKEKVVYTALEATQALHLASFNIPFSVFIVVDEDTSLTKNFNLSAYIEDVFVCQLSERSLFKNTTIFIKASPICQEKL